MATSTTVTQSSLPPRYFRLNSSIDDASGVITVAVERCQLCDGTKRAFVCQHCIKKGDFGHSKFKQVLQHKKLQFDNYCDIKNINIVEK